MRETGGKKRKKIKIKIKKKEEEEVGLNPCEFAWKPLCHPSVAGRGPDTYAVPYGVARSPSIGSLGVLSFNFLMC